MFAGLGCDPIPGLSQLTPDTAYLVVRNGPKAQSSFPLNRLRSLIGRNHPPHIVVDIDLSGYEPDQIMTISRHHAIVQWVNQKLQIVDLASRNGTFVNGLQLLSQEANQPSAPALLTVGSKIRLGDLEFEVTMF
ncbi:MULTISPECIES: FHA domain-containing protein [Nostocales]|uniref:FHA domain-containing protein n=3 Tax=Nostocales TaxID=1161 RepID=A0A0C1N3V2_9CYAN|nr:FHA domain-containing protein [Tolypothrix bouteillei]KAF3889442.1 FHA domain-containing protein [Tolypothrix bouteillei VB521301]